LLLFYLLHKKLIDNVKHEDSRPMTEFEKARSETLDHLTEEILRKFLVPPTTMPLNELLIFDDLPSIKRKIVGEDRAAQYTAFVNPQYYINVKNFNMYMICINLKNN